eukprot:CAMPEP_0116886802 /NCGR_PEP_ID=MMETSP0463-20121206/20761_1 /TAXON_ID=181622 /ORGANISM="Strombidinopsis sp, Strain SopsisLIS2011" /LENGTH=66 /DNA_ID=CAMNT_0004547805 /DNA_START=1610 /DNA_END=1810 /DNA_ORIENTATION=+
MKCLKDTNFLINNSFKQEVNLSRESRKKLLEILYKDSAFLRDKGIMDYSVLLGIEEVNTSVRNSGV